MRLILVHNLPFLGDKHIMHLIIYSSGTEEDTVSLCLLYTQCCCTLYYSALNILNVLVNDCDCVD